MLNSNAVFATVSRFGLLLILLTDDCKVPRSSGHFEWAHVCFVEELRMAEALHIKERCPSCGVWKHKLRECSVCTRFPNRAQAADAQVRATPANLTPIGIGARTLDEGPIVMPRDIFLRATSSTSSSKLHTKERCRVCGVWKSKERPCYHCVELPTRVQARLAQQRNSDTMHVLFSDAAIARAALVGSPQRPQTAPAYESISRDIAQLHGTISAKAAARAKSRAHGPLAYKGSGLYSTPSGLRRIVASAGAWR